MRISRRHFLAAAAFGAAATAAPGKTVLTFYVDDTNPYTAGADAFKQFLDFVAEHKLAGEASMILGFASDEHGLISRPRTAEQRAYIQQLQRAYECGIDSHMELMTHGGLLDFRTGRIPKGAEHEGVWLYEPNVSLDQYGAYFSQIVAEADNIGVRFTGVTWPGCGCGACDKRDRELRKNGVLTENPNVWKALLNLAERGKFRGPTVPCFILGEAEEHPLKAMARNGKFAVYDLYPNARDLFGTYENNPAKVNADYYITADGKSGRIVEKILARAPRCVMYSHWQGVNPAKGVGWNAFRQVMTRVQQFYGDRVVWMRPSALTDQAVTADTSADGSGRGSGTEAKSA